MRLHFDKYQAAGNDFVLLKDWERNLDLTPPIGMALCDRRFGVGADGLIIVRPSSECEFTALFFNPDGSQAEVCGNGLRCAACYWHRQTGKTGDLVIETGGGSRQVKILSATAGGIEAEVDLGPPDFRPAAIPMSADVDEVASYTLKVGDDSYDITALSVGNPHCVLFVPDVEATDVATVGHLIEHHSLFPNRTNVEFVQILTDDSLKVRVWERGVGETLACGTGASAAVAAALRRRLIGMKVKVKLPGGELEIERLSDNHLLLRGEANLVFEGDIDLGDIKLSGERGAL